MTSLVVGASGATGRLLVAQLLDRGQNVRAIVRSPDALPAAARQNDRLTVIQAGILDLSDTELAQEVKGCTAVASCLGHNLSLKGIYGHPRRLVTEAVVKLCRAVKANEPGKTTKFVLMNTAGNSNRDLQEPISLSQKFVIALIRRLLPPHADNEQAADFLRGIGRNDRMIEWVAVRPDTLTDESEVTEYEVHPSPTRSAVFNAGKTSRINTAHFMAELITDNDTWHRWQGKMPVVYNKGYS